MLHFSHGEAGYLSGSHLVAVRVHGGQDVDARVVDEARDAVVPGPVLLTQELAELDEQLAAQHLVAVHVAHILELRLHWGGGERGVSAKGEGQGWTWGWGLGVLTFQASSSARCPLDCTLSLNKTGELISWLSSSL